jgi:hypothetical protein
MEVQASPELRHYSVDSAHKAVERLRLNLAAGLVEPGYVESRLQFRDPTGRAWCLGLRTGRWYRPEGGGWRVVGELPTDLEGHADLAGQLPALEAIRSPVPEAEVATQVGVRAGLGAAAAVVKGLHDAYLAGSLTSGEATSMLDELTLLELDGTPWAPGFHSGRWFALRQAGWEQAASPPDVERFRQTPADPVGLAQAALARLEAHPLPEPVAEPWSPVIGYPEQLRCPTCVAVQTTDQALCWNCGQPAPVLASAGQRAPTPASGAQVDPAGSAGPIPAALSAIPGAAAAPSPEVTPTPPTLRHPPPVAQPSGWRLVVIGGSAPQPVYHLGTTLTFGRDVDNHVQLADPRTSRRHARIERSGEGYRILDLGSSNGTFLNDVRLTGPAPLGPLDQVQIGDTVFAVQAPPAHGMPAPEDLAGDPTVVAGAAHPGMPPRGAVLVAPPGHPGMSAPGIVPVAPPAPAPPAPRSGRRLLIWGGLGCLALAASLAACGLALRLMNVI